MSRLSAMRILTKSVQFSTKGQWKKETAQTPTDIKTDIVSPALLNAVSVAAPLSVGNTTSQAGIMWLGLVQGTWKARRIVPCFTFPMKALNLHS